MNHPLLEAALAQRLISPKQYELVSAEVSSDPRVNIGELLLSRHYLTRSQLQGLMAVKVDPTVSQFDESLDDSNAVEEERAAAQSAMAPAAAPAPAPVVEAPAAAPAAPAGTQPKKLRDMLRLARHWGCSDLHITVGRPPFVRLNGGIRYMEMDPLDEETAGVLNFSLLTEEQAAEVSEKLTLDYALDLGESGRYRCNVFHQRLGWDGVYRIIPQKVPTIDELGLPDVCRRLTEYHQGMVLVTGPGRSGKTTTIAAMVHHVNQIREDHIITVEDPIEYVHRPARCQVTQREIGPHSLSFPNALRAALREDPDIIFIGEMRDLETTQIAISAAETGHLVFSTLHTGSAARTVSRILDVFPIRQQDQVRVMISESLRGVVSQQLIPRRDKQGLALALEILVVTSGVTALLKEGKTHQLTSMMQAGKKSGMKTMDESLNELVQAGTISGAEGYRRAENKAMFEAVKDQ